jgi:hypothetical protein
MAWTRTYQEAEPQRVNRWLAQSGVCSRREAEALIARGLVRIDGEPVADPGRKIMTGQTLTVADDAASPAGGPLTVMLHKPVGVVSGQPEPGQVPAVRLTTSGGSVVSLTVGATRVRTEKDAAVRIHFSRHRADRFESGEDVGFRLRVKQVGVEKIGPAEHVENGVGTAVTIGSIQKHPGANRPDLVEIFFHPGAVQISGVIRPGRVLNERGEGTAYRDAGKEARGFIQSRALLRESGRRCQNQKKQKTFHECG